MCTLLSLFAAVAAGTMPSLVLGGFVAAMPPRTSRADACSRVLCHLAVLCAHGVWDPFVCVYIMISLSQAVSLSCLSSGIRDGVGRQTHTHELVCLGVRCRYVSRF